MISSEVRSLESFPLVTVFTLIYNTNPRFVIEAIESVRANNYPNLQHIIIDDCSPNPEPKRVVKEWINREKYLCEFYEHEVNYGVCKTLNHVLELAKGKYLLGCSDDLITVDRIFNDVEIFNSLSEEYAIVFGLTQEINSSSQLQPRVFPNLIVPNQDNYWSLLINKNVFPAPSTTYRVCALKEVGGFNENLSFEDYEINLRFSYCNYRFKCIPKINSFYRIHDKSMSQRLNFEIERIKILSLFKDRNEVKEILFKQIWLMAYHKKDGYRDSIQVFEKAYSKSLKLRFISYMKSKRLIRLSNKIFKLDRI